MEPGTKPTGAVLAGLPLLAGWGMVALADAFTTLRRPRAHAPLSVVGVAYLVDAFHLIAVGLAVFGGAALLHRLAPRSRRLGYLAAAVVALALAHPVLGLDVAGPAGKMGKTIPFALAAGVMTVGAALTVPLTALVGGWLARPWLRLLGVAGGAAAAIANGLVLPEGYSGFHLLAAVLAATLTGASLRGASFLARLVPASPRRGLVCLAALAVPAAAALVIPPSNRVALLLANRPSAVLAPYLGPLYPARQAPLLVPPAQRAWFTDRSRLPAVPPSAPSLLPPSSIVILLGVDSLRADLLADERHRPTLPTLFALKDRSTYFSQARAAGSSTAPSFAAIFTGRYYSQLYWAFGRGGRLPYPHGDRSPRFPELLSRAGVRTCSVDATGWLDGHHGIARGFKEEENLKGGNYGAAKAMITRAIAHLDGGDGQPAFIFLHLLDAHFPYRAGGVKPTPREGHLASLGVVDKEIGRLLAAIDHAGLSERTTLVVLSDHGEAFGEHGLSWHASSLYDELLRVPLMIALPSGKPRVVADPVSLIDLGPTILDLMGVATPGTYMGESLVGYLRGERPALHRPIVAEGRLKRAIILPDGYKVVRDPRAGFVEVFDLRNDPGEETNLYDEGSPAIVERVGVLDAFFDANTLRRKGYVVPYRKW